MLSWLQESPAVTCSVIAAMTLVALLMPDGRHYYAREARSMAELEARAARLEARVAGLSEHMLRLDALVVEILCRQLRITGEAGGGDSEGNARCGADMHGGELRSVAGDEPVAGGPEPLDGRVQCRHRAGAGAAGVLAAAGDDRCVIPV